jgi:hypothetical protein
MPQFNHRIFGKVDEVKDTSPSLQALDPKNKYGSQSLCDNHKSFVIGIE